MKMYKFYDTFCDCCDEWWGTEHKIPHVKNKEEAKKEMEENGWVFIGEKVYCYTCICEGRVKLNK